MEQFPIFELDQPLIAQGVENEAYGLASITESQIFRELLTRFSDYSTFLSDRPKDPAHRKAINKLLEKHKRTLSTCLDSPLLQDAFLTAHFAACCELFNGSRIPIGHLRRDNVANWVTSEIRNHTTPEALHQLASRLHSMDAVRTMQILRVLGLITRPTPSVHQLSLGAGPATKDIRSIHLLPHASITHAGSMAQSTTIMEHLAMSMSENHASDIVITDSDPQRATLYQDLNALTEPKLLAINRDTFQTLHQLPDILQDTGMAPRNLVIALRIDHRMIPDTHQFLAMLARIIDDSADLVITIGSGFTLDDFSGRSRTLRELTVKLEECKLEPILINLHGPGSLEAQRNNPSFGLSNITTYEILYCKLKRKRLDAADSKQH